MERVGGWGKRTFRARQLPPAAHLPEPARLPRLLRSVRPALVPRAHRGHEVLEVEPEERVVGVAVEGGTPGVVEACGGGGRGGRVVCEWEGGRDRSDGGRCRSQRMLTRDDVGPQAGADPLEVIQAPVLATKGAPSSSSTSASCSAVVREARAVKGGPGGIFRPERCMCGVGE